MSEERKPRPFGNVIPAAPGWRVVRLFGDSPDCPEPSFEPVIAWAEMPDEPGCLVPLHRAGWADPVVLPVDIDEPNDSEFEFDFFFCLLAPGEELDPGDETWRPRIRCWFKHRNRTRQTDPVVRS